MASVHELLEAGEEIVERTTISRFDSGYLKWYVISLVFLVLAGVSAFTSLVSNVVGQGRWLFAGFFGAIFLIIFLVTEIRRYFVAYYFTDRKIVEEVGVFSKDIKTINYDNVTDTHLDKNFRERIFGVGDLKINTAGGDYQEIVLEGLSSLEHYKSLISEKSSESSGYKSGDAEDRERSQGKMGERDVSSSSESRASSSSRRGDTFSRSSFLEDIKSRIGELEMKKSNLEEMFNRGELSEEEYRKHWYILKGRERELKEMLEDKQ